MEHYPINQAHKAANKILSGNEVHLQKSEVVCLGRTLGFYCSQIYDLGEGSFRTKTLLDAIEVWWKGSRSVLCIATSRDSLRQHRRLLEKLIASTKKP